MLKTFVPMRRENFRQNVQARPTSELFAREKKKHVEVAGRVAQDSQHKGHFTAMLCSVIDNMHQELLLVTYSHSLCWQFLLSRKKRKKVCSCPSPVVHFVMLGDWKMRGETHNTERLHAEIISAHPCLVPGTSML